MRLLWRNTTEFEYLANLGAEDDLNEQGEHTGDYSGKIAYAEPVRMWGNISSPSGQTERQFYGLERGYTHTLVMHGADTGIAEGGLIRWQGRLYDIVAVRPSINQTSIALKRQTENEEEQP